MCCVVPAAASEQLVLIHHCRSDSLGVPQLHHGIGMRAVMESLTVACLGLGVLPLDNSQSTQPDLVLYVKRAESQVHNTKLG